MPMVMSKSEWARLSQWTERGREDLDATRRREYVRYLDTTSREMTKKWPNSLENVSKRNDEQRRLRLEAAERANSRFYKKYLKRKKREQEQLMYSARDTVFKNKDAPKLLLSAVLESCTLKERAEQVKFLRELKRQAAEQKKKDDQDVIRKAKKWEIFQADQKKKRFEFNKKHQMDIIAQTHEISEKNRKEYEDELRMQNIDNVIANQQIEAIKEFEEKFKADEKARIMSDMRQARKEYMARQTEQATKDRLDDRLIDVLTKSRARIEKKRKKTEMDEKAEKQRVLDAISSKLESGDGLRDAQEQVMLEKAVKEKNEATKARQEKRENRAARMRAERVEAHAQWQRDEEQRLHEFNNARTWEFMNRFKNLEIYEEHNEKVSQEKRENIKDFRDETLRLWKEREDREARELAETRYFYGELAQKKLRDADNKVLMHADELLREARECGRPEYPIHKTIDRYCKLNRLYPMPDLPRSMQEHFQRYAPVDGSRPDPHYEAEPASRTKLAAGAARNGLNNADKPTTSSSAKKQQEESVMEYKRASRANGLQRKTSSLDLTLPPPTVVPCKHEDCRCELKQ